MGWGREAGWWVSGRIGRHPTRHLAHMLTSHQYMQCTLTAHTIIHKVSLPPKSTLSVCTIAPPFAVLARLLTSIHSCVQFLYRGATKKTTDRVSHLDQG